MLLGPYTVGEILLFLLPNLGIGVVIWQFSGKEGRPKQGMQLLAAWALLVFAVLSHPSIQYRLALSRVPSSTEFEIEARSDCWRFINSYDYSSAANNCAVAIYSENIKKVWFSETDGGRRWLTSNPWTWLLLLASSGAFFFAWRERE